MHAISMTKLVVFLTILFIAKPVVAQISLPRAIKGKAQHGRSILIRQDGGAFIYLTATGGNFYSGRLFPNGDIDDAYNGARSSKKTFGQLVNCTTITAKHDKWGRMIIAGSSCVDSGSGKVATMVRLTKNGDPDADFQPGIAQLKVGDSSEFIGIYLLGDEKIMTIGSCYTGGGYHIFFARFQYNGEKDLSFGRNGIIIDDDTFSNSRDLLTAVQPEGKYVITATDGEHLIVKRYNVDGTRDTTFGAKESISVIGEPLKNVHSDCLLVQPDGKILISGTYPGEKKGTDIFLIRLIANGATDSLFGKSGIVKTGVTADDRVDDMVLLPDGRILLSGAGSAKGEAKYSRYIMLRFSAEGTTEKGYGYGSEKGLSPASVGIGYTSLANNIAISPLDGKVNRLSEIIGGSETETILTFTTYLQDSSLGIVDIPSLKLQNFVYPVPVSKNVTFTFNLVEDLAISVKLVDANGNEIAIIENKELYTEGDNTVTINFPPNCKPGKYLVVLSSEAGYKVTVEVSKNL